MRRLFYYLLRAFRYRFPRLPSPPNDLDQVLISSFQIEQEKERLQKKKIAAKEEKQKSKEKAEEKKRRQKIINGSYLTLAFELLGKNLPSNPYRIYLTNKDMGLDLEEFRIFKHFFLKLCKEKGITIEIDYPDEYHIRINNQTVKNW
jgi:hypothetical protein